MKKTEIKGVYFPSPEVAASLKTANNWAFYILNECRKGIPERNFYKLYLYAKELPEIYGAPEEMQSEITELIKGVLKNLAQM